MIIDTDEWVALTEASHVARCSAPQVVLLARKGVVSTVDFGRSFRIYNKIELLAWADAHRPVRR